MLIPHLYCYAVVIVMSQHLRILFAENLEVHTVDLELVTAVSIYHLRTFSRVKSRIEPLSLGCFIFLQLDQFVSET